MLGLAEFDLHQLDLGQLDLGPVPLDWVRKHRLLPFYSKKTKHLIAISQYSDLAKLKPLTLLTGHSFHPILCDQQALQSTIQRILQQEKPQSRITTDKSAISNHVNQLIVHAIEQRASDIHLEPYEQSYRIRLRIDGKLIHSHSPPKESSNQIISHIKILGRLDITETRKPQDGRFKLDIPGRGDTHFRLSSCPTLFGEKLVIRILGGTGPQPNINKLGLLPHQLHALQQAIQKPHGLILVTGPTGSGKTLTLYSILQALNHGSENISTAEDPIEILLPGINQLNINPAAGLTFPTALRAFLRQDPDVLMVGEIRDEETACIAIRAAQTGHLVLSSLHSSSATLAIDRLCNMGISHFDLASCLNLVIAQRLIRTLCSHCQGLSHLDCQYCHQGFLGRSAIFELLPVNQYVQQLIEQRANNLKIQAYNLQSGQYSLAMAAQHKVKSKITTMAEIQPFIEHSNETATEKKALSVASHR
ncbi:GspE/PulE family protein [Piscirickettsia litoralis]|uniref:GspE/PulE family protein n=1 Tax=Piscirickettsia litoralis TaxID=1891921 RepID=UPI0013015F0C|nr:GspE/PulE family protein [Piscirickettsia litoralis]